ncbi:MAG TPA: methylmalonyl-CoA mutase family protein [Acidobacteriaceae bacterium]|jgi:methylmalonyl-CoA mutase N-terminal domain/subunit|nr:methylmalonyl-CoA mutase family protein [Acidobacteriaceae bacterium]
MLKRSAGAVAMADKKTEELDSLTSEVTAGRHPTAAELHWVEKTLRPALEKNAEHAMGAASGVNRDDEGKARFTTISGVPVQRLYTPADLPEDGEARPAGTLGAPGEAPYTRGIHPMGYRGRLWTMRQFSGFASPEETNLRYKYLLEGGANGLSVAFDLPTLMGCDSDDPKSEGEVGKCGVAIDSLADMETLFSGIRLDSTTVSMTINSPASVLWAMYLVVAEKQGVDWKQVSGTLQNDILKEYIAQKEYLYPPAPSMRLVVDTLEFGARSTPKFNPISISGYHIREAGSTALQELAFTLYDGIEYVEWALRRGLAVDDFAPRLSFFFNAHNDFFEEIAKYRAARKVWYRVMTERFGAKNPRSQWMRFHTQTAGVSLTAQQPVNNIARVALQALAGVLGGTQSLHTDGFDEALALPTEDAARIALRTQQILAYESGVAEIVDPLGGSYFLEKLTLDMEEGAFRIFAKLDALGGMVKAIEAGYPQKEIAEASYAYQRAVEAGEKIIVGVNRYAIDEPPPRTLYIDESVRDAQAKKLRELRATRSNEAVQRCLDALRRTAEEQPQPANAGLATANTMPVILDCVRAYATVGEICGALGEVFGGWEEA